MTRRGFLGAVSALALTAALPRGAFALTDAQAKSLVDNVVRDINKVIASGKSLSSMIKDFERIFTKYADVPIIARSALGADARRASKSVSNRHSQRGTVASFLTNPLEDQHVGVHRHAHSQY